MKRSVALLALLLGSFGGVASAQDVVAFETLARGAHGGYGPAANHVIRSQQDLQQTGVDRLLPPGTQIDWSRDMVIAVLMGTKNTGGYSVEITGINRQQMMTIMPIPAPPPTYYLEVSADHRSPAPGSIVTMALTSPFHVVKLRRYRERVDFVATSGGGGAAVTTGPVTFESVVQGANSGASAAANLVLRSQQELQASGIRLGPGAQVDWTRDMLIAVLMGTKNTGGYSVEITGIERKRMIAPTIFPPPPPVYYLEVTADHRSPAPGSMVTMALTSPFHVVKLARSDERVDFVASGASSGGAGFDAVERSTRSAIAQARIRVSASGDVTFARSGMGNPFPTLTGQATAAELRDLESAVSRARLHEIPADITPGSLPAGGSMFTLTVEGGSNPHRISGAYGLEGQYAARLRLVNQALDAIGSRLASQPAPAGAFNTITYGLTKGLTSEGVSLRLADDGRATVQRTHPAALIAPVQGTATAAELAAVDRAVRAARVASIPDHLPVPIHIVAGDTFQLDIVSSQATLDGHVDGEPGYLQSYEARLRPLFDALDAIIDRLAPAGPRIEEAKGVVRVEGNQVLLVESPGKRYRIKNAAFADVIRKFVGRTVKVEGEVEQIVATVYPATVGVEVTAILSPERRTDERVQVQAGSNRVFVQGDAVTTFGPAARALRLFAGRSHTVDGYLWLDASGRPEELFVEAVSARAKEFSVLTRNGQWAGYVRKNQRVELLGFSGNAALVRAGARTGYMATSRLDAGEVPVPLHGPTPGLTGSVPGQ
jgi:hypothetical protein